jgi:hypothetical protein
VIGWSYSFAAYIPVAAEYRDRIARIAAAPRDTVAVVAPYEQIWPTFWLYGEDWYDASVRQRVATALYHLRDIEMSPRFRRMEVNTPVEFRFEIEGASPEELRAVPPPVRWASNLKTARLQFNAVIDGLADRGNRTFTARLFVTNMNNDVLRGRPLYAAVFEDGSLTNLVITRRPPDDENHITVLIRPRAFAARFPETYAVMGDRTTPIGYVNRRYAVQAMTTELHAVIACDPARCFLVDAFFPTL